MPPVGRRKSFIPSPGGPGGTGVGGSTSGASGGGIADDITHLSLAEVQARLERNARVLGLALFSPSPSTSPLSPGPLNGPFPPSATTSSPTPHARAPADPVREKLLAARQALLDRQSELLLQSAQNGLSSIHVDPSFDPPGLGAGSPVAGPSKSGSQRALQEIRMKDRDLTPRSRMIPIDEAQSLAERDHDDATARRLSALTLTPDAEPSAAGTRRIPRRTLGGLPIGGGGGRGRGLEDEYTRAQAAARMRAFMSVIPAEDEFFFDADDEDFTPRGEYARPSVGDGGGGGGIVGGEVEGEYAEDMLDTGREGRAEGERVYRTVGAGEEVDVYGEDDEMWPEGNDDDAPDPRAS